MTYYKNRKNQHGLTMVELMIAMMLSLVVGAAVITVFVNNSYSFKQDDNILRMQDDARFALSEISRDLSMAGHYADLLLPGSITPDTSLAIGTDCGPAGQPNWVYQTVLAGTATSLSVVAVDNATPASALANFSCIAAGTFQAGTDIVSIKRVVGARTAVPSASNIYLRTNGTVGLLYREPMAGAPVVDVPVPRAEWEYRPSIYYVRNFANVAGDGIPTLCRKVLRGAAPNMTTECIATGIEDLQIEYGIDTTGDSNPNLFMPNPNLVQMQAVVSARIFLLARTSNIDTRYTNDKTYVLSNSPAYTPGDTFHRRVFSATVSIQNIRSMNKMGF